MALDDSVKLAAILIGSQLLVVATFVLLALGVIDGPAILFGVFGILLVVALILLSGRGAGILIAGYNTLPESEKTKYNAKGLARAMGMMLLGIDFATFLFAVTIERGMDWLSVIGIIASVALIIGSVVWINTGERYKRQDA